MSTPYDPDAQVEQRSSIKISSTAKGDPQVEVKVYDGTTPADLDALRTAAVTAYRQTRADVGWPLAAQGAS